MPSCTHHESQPDVPSLRLILMRHAKSDWGDSRLSDHERPLNPRGRRDSPRMATWMAENGLIPEIILSSSSRRTEETAQLMFQSWQDAQVVVPEIRFSDELYLASPTQMIDSIRDQHEGCSVVMVLAHNPGISVLSSMIAGQAIDMPTAALASFLAEPDAATEDLDAAQYWSQFSIQRSAFESQPRMPMTLTHFMRPMGLVE